MAAMVRDRFAVTATRALVAAVATAALVGCGVQPGPTPLAPAARNQVEVVWENLSDEVHVVSVVGTAPEQRGFGLVEPCTRHGMTVAADPPFDIGLGVGADMETQPTVVRSEDLDEPADGLYRVFVRIDAEGDVTSGALLGNQEFGPEVC